MDRDIYKLVNEANKKAVEKMTEVKPVLTKVIRLDELHPELKGKKMLTHSGPPVTWEKMSGGQKGAALCVSKYMKWANSFEELGQLIESGEITLTPNHELNGVLPMGGVCAPDMQVFIVEDIERNIKAYSGIEFDAYFGAYDDEAVDEIRRWNEIFYPAINAALADMGGLELKPIMTQALTMGDELHSRQVASSAVFAKKMAPYITKNSERKAAELTQAELNINELTFLPLAMASSKVAMLNASDIPYSTIVTLMSRNGTEFGIKVSGTGGQWFTAPSPYVETVYFPGYKKGDDGPDLGDSAITETNGLGGFCFAAAPAITGMINATVEDLVEYTLEMRKIAEGSNSAFGIPLLNFESAACGIDIRKVMQTSIAPIIDTASAHKDPGHRIVGVGKTRAPMECFEKALNAWLNKYE